MLKKILISLALSIPTFALAEPLSVSPPNLKSLPSLELGQAILKFMPSTTGSISWSTNANDQAFKWLDKGFVEASYNGDTTSHRRGIFRSNVNGVKSTFLDDREYEMPWLVTLRGESLGKFGVDSVIFYPYVLASDPDDSGSCLGPTHTNCDFSPFNSLKQAGISYKKVCEKKLGADFDMVYLLSKTGKKNTYGIWSGSGGSGGSSSSFALDFSSSNSEICKKIKE